MIDIHNNHLDFSGFTEPYMCNIFTNKQPENTKFHTHSFHELFFLLEGEIQYFVENACYPLKKGDLILFTNQEIHKAINVTGKKFTRCVIHFDASFIQKYSTEQTNLLACFEHVPGRDNLIRLSSAENELMLSLCRLFHDTLQGKTSYGSDLTALTAFLRILVLINTAWQENANGRPAPKPHKAQSLMNYIDQHLTEDLTLDTISAALSMDKYYLSHLFKSETQSSIFQYILVKRIGLAKDLLAKGHTVTEACHLSGFHDYSNFIRTFRQIAGQTPGKFRKSI